MKKFMTILLLTLTACSAIPETASLMPLATASTMAVFESQTPSVTPTATIGYYETAIAAQAAQGTAQAQADNANRLLVQATSDAEARQHAEAMQYAQMTAQAQAEEMIVLGWTATAQLTAIPATQTQQAVNNVIIPTQQALMASAQMMTKQAPTQLVSMAQAEAQARFAPMAEVVRVTFFLSMTVMMAALAWFVFTRGQKVERQEPDMPFIVPSDWNEGTVVTVKNETRTQGTRLVIPATAEMLNELAVGVIHGGKTLAINYWEGSQSDHWTRETYYQMRNWLLSNGMAKSSGQGGLVLTAEGEGLLRGWLDNHRIPPLYSFASNLMGNHGEIPHTHENHTHEMPVGEVA